jgi:tetratricopeptide (TPR) repeat protein
VQKTNNVKYYLASAVALVAFLVYLSALRNDFVYWDDNLYIFDNPYIRSLDAVFFRWAFLGFHVSNWHPLTWISHAVDYAIWGLNPLGHHLTNIILHAANTALVVMLAMKLLEVARWRSVKNGPSSFLNDRTVLIAAGVTGLLFGIHPLHVESVAWVSERKDLLCALFYLMSIIAYTKYAISREPKVGNRQSDVEGGNEPGRKGIHVNKHYILALGFFILALMSKPMAVSLPVVLLILDWYPFGRIRSRKTFWAAVVEKFPFVALSFVSSLLTILAQKAGEAIISVEQMPISVRVVVAAKSLVAYLVNMLLPINLIPFYPYPNNVSLLSLENLLSIGLVVGVTSACLAFAKKQKQWVSALGYFIVTLVPVLGIVQVGAQSMADRYTYLPSLGPFLMAGLCASWVAERVFRERKNLSLKIAFCVAFSFVAVFLVYATMKQTHIWKDSITLWSYVIEKQPDKVSLAYSQRGIVFGKKGMTDRAIADLEMAISLNPYNYDAYMNLAVAQEKLGQLDRARENVEKAVSVKPASHEAYIYRGVLYEELGQLDKAIGDYTKAIALDPSDLDAYNDRGIAFGKRGQFDKAIADYSEAIRLNPNHIDAYSNRGVAYTLTGQYDRAAEDFNAAILLDPNDAVTYYNRGSFYRRTGKNDLAFSDFQKACDLGDERGCGMMNRLRQGQGSK